MEVLTNMVAHVEEVFNKDSVICPPSIKRTQIIAVAARSFRSLHHSLVRPHFLSDSHSQIVKMHFSLAVIAAFAGLVAAAPTELQKRQMTANDLSGACKKVTLIFARVSFCSSILGTQSLTLSRPVPNQAIWSAASKPVLFPGHANISPGHEHGTCSLLRS